ncbi:hypothetical protein FRC09_007319 [Ceratobasidium sp. 395]|nr:hypothetical protein FRC09_007319 [Ceratobasidium sp. 395]
MPIDLHIEEEDKISSDVISELMLVLQPHATAVQQLSISGVNTPRLAKAFFNMCPKYGTPVMLKSLVLKDVGVPREKHALSWPIDSLSGLVELDLADLTEFAAPLLNDLVAVLSNCQALHTLRLHNVEIRTRRQEHYQAISLPQLRLLELVVFYDNDGMEQLLELLSPGSHALDIRLNHSSADHSSFARHIQSLLARSNVAYLTIQNVFPSSISHFKSRTYLATPHVISARQPFINWSELWHRAISAASSFGPADLGYLITRNQMTATKNT